jgi:hypothetical protein
MARGNPSATEIDVHGQLIAVDRAVPPYSHLAFLARVIGLLM